MRIRLMLLVVMAVPIMALAAGTGHDPTNSRTKNTRASQVRPQSVAPAPAEAAAPNFNLAQVVVNCGGNSHATGINARSGISVGQPVTGMATSASYRLGFGYWYGTSGAAACPVQMTGDANADGLIQPPDLIYLVNYVLRAGPDPLPCAATGDVDCNGAANIADLIFIVNYIFRAGPAPCDVCNLIPGNWSCP